MRGLAHQLHDASHMPNGRGDEVRFEASVREYVHAIARRYVHDHDAADDVAQEALLTAFRHKDSFRGESRFTTWLYRVTVTTALMYLRKHRRFPAATAIPVAGGEDAELRVEGPSPEDEIAARQALSRTCERLRYLGDNYVAIFRMRFADGWSEHEIAKRLGVRVSTVKNRIYRGRNHLRERRAA